MENLWLKVCCCILLLLVLSPGQSADTVWVQRLLAEAPGGGRCHSRGKGITLDGQGNIYIGGDGGVGWAYGLLLKYSTRGDFIWGTWLLGYNEYMYFNAMDYNPVDNTIAIAGSEWDASSNPDHALRTYKRDANGNPLWRARYREIYGFATDVVMDDSGNVYVVGSSSYDFLQRNAIIIRYESEGTGGVGIETWQDQYWGSSQAMAFVNSFSSVACDNEGYIYAAGSCVDQGTRYNFVTIKYNPQNGSRVWLKKYEGSNDDYGENIAIDNANYIYVSGESRSLGTGYSGILVIKYNSNGDTVWTGKYDISGYNFTVKKTKVDRTGNVYIAGDVSHSRAIDAFIAKFSANGQFEWIRYYNGPGNNTDQAEGIALDNAGNIYITGWAAVPLVGNDDYDYFTLKCNPQGDIIWTVLYDGPGTTYMADQAWDIVVDDSGYVYVTGESDGGDLSGGTSDCTTIKYRQSGPHIFENSGDVVGCAYSIGQNPFKDATEISFTLNQPSQVAIKLYDCLGKYVKEVVNSKFPCGRHQVRLNAGDLSGGVYFLRLVTTEFLAKEKLIILK